MAKRFERGYVSSRSRSRRTDDALVGKFQSGVPSLQRTVRRFGAQEEHGLSEDHLEPEGIFQDSPGLQSRCGLDAANGNDCQEHLRMARSIIAGLSEAHSPPRPGSK